MLTRTLKQCKEIVAGDNTLLRELFNPEHGDNVSFRYSLAHAVVKPGQITAPHRMKTSELYYILDGEGRMMIEDESQDVHAGQAISIPPNATQSIQNTGKGDLKFLCIVDPAWRKEDEEIL